MGPTVASTSNPSFSFAQPAVAMQTRTKNRRRRMQGGPVRQPGGHGRVRPAGACRADPSVSRAATPAALAITGLLLGDQKAATNPAVAPQRPRESHAGAAEGMSHEV